jgi:uncharacterized membrane protein YhaH (DUF805 family)
MTFLESIRVCLTKYSDFSGTASRSEYWWFALFLTLAGAAASVATPTLLPARSLGAVFFLATLLPLLAAGTRRLRDTGRSGWLQLFVLVPVAGIVVLAVFLAQEGKEGAVVPEAAKGEPAAGA